LGVMRTSASPILYCITYTVIAPAGSSDGAPNGSAERRTSLDCAALVTSGRAPKAVVVARSGSARPPARPAARASQRRRVRREACGCIGQTPRAGSVAEALGAVGNMRSRIS
jgi:hypothetical protein